MVFVGADSSGIDPGLYTYMRDEVGQVDVAFLGMECAGAPLTWLYQGLFTKPVTKKMSSSRTLSGSNAEQAAAITTDRSSSLRSSRARCRKPPRSMPACGSAGTPALRPRASWAASSRHRRLGLLTSHLTHSNQPDRKRDNTDEH